MSEPAAAPDATGDPAPSATAPCGPSWTGLSDNAWRAAVVYTLAAALLLRLMAIDIKPLHHDEGVNGYFLTKLVRPPHVYQYDPLNYHGPTLYYFARVSAAIFGLTTFAIRFVPAICGLVAVCLLLSLRRRLGTLASLAAGMLLTLSPGAVFHSRYFIHESLLVCFTIGLVVACVAYRAWGRPASLVMASVCAALMFATKETWTITIGVLVCAAAATRLSLALLAPSPAVAPMGSPPRPSLYTAASAIAAFGLVSALFYTSLFTEPRGMADAFRSLAVWSTTGQVAHVQPWYSYLKWLVQEESPLVGLGAAGILLAFWRRDNRFAIFSGWWAAGMLAAYSLVPYKTPWLTANMLPPLALCGGYEVEQVARMTTVRGPQIVGALAIGAVMMYQTIVLNFVRYDDFHYPYVYGQTSRELLKLVDEIGRVVGSTREPIDVSVMSPNQFPLSWYLRDVNAGYPGKVHDFNGGLIVADVQQAPELEALVGDRFVLSGTYTLRPGVLLRLYVRRDLSAILR